MSIELLSNDFEIFCDFPRCDKKHGPHKDLSEALHAMKNDGWRIVAETDDWKIRFFNRRFNHFCGEH